MSLHDFCRPCNSGTVSTITTPLDASVGKKLAIFVPLIGALTPPVIQSRLGESAKCKDPRFLQRLVNCTAEKRAFARAVLQACRLPKEYVDPILRQTSGIDKGRAAPTPAAPTRSVPCPAPPNDQLSATDQRGFVRFAGWRIAFQANGRSKKRLRGENMRNVTRIALLGLALAVTLPSASDAQQPCITKAWQAYNAQDYINALQAAT